jgi:predicted RNase H-like HicB family nuclease
MAKRSLDFSSVVTKEGKWYVATGPELGITSQGKNFEAALENLREAIEPYLEDDEAKIPEASNRPSVTAASGRLRSDWKKLYST